MNRETFLLSFWYVCMLFRRLFLDAWNYVTLQAVITTIRMRNGKHGGKLAQHLRFRVNDFRNCCRAAILIMLCTAFLSPPNPVKRAAHCAPFFANWNVHFDWSLSIFVWRVKAWHLWSTLLRWSLGTKPPRSGSGNVLCMTVQLNPDLHHIKHSHLSAWSQMTSWGWERSEKWTKSNFAASSWLAAYT